MGWIWGVLKMEPRVSCTLSIAVLPGHISGLNKIAYAVIHRRQMCEHLSDAVLIANLNMSSLV